MKLDHAELAGVQIGFPPSLGIQMTVVLNVTNPNSYDVAVRAFRGQTVMNDKYTVPINWNPGGDGVWLPANQTTQVRVLATVPIQTALAVTHEAVTGVVNYKVTGKADVTATKSLKIEKDNYAVDEKGQFSKQLIDASIAAIGIPFMH